MNTGKTITKNS